MINCPLFHFNFYSDKVHSLSANILVKLEVMKTNRCISVDIWSNLFRILRIRMIRLVQIPNVQIDPISWIFCSSSKRSYGKKFAFELSVQNDLTRRRDRDLVEI